MPPASVNQPQGEMGIFIGVPTCLFIGGTWTPTRGAAGNYFNRKTGAAETANIAVNISRAIRRIRAATFALASPNLPLGAELQEGGLLTGFDLIYAIGTADLTSLTPTLYETLYANAAAPVVSANPGGAILSWPTTGVATPVALQADPTKPYVAKFQLTTPYVIGRNVGLVSDWLELAIVDPGTSVFDFYGLLLKFQANK